MVGDISNAAESWERWGQTELGASLEGLALKKADRESSLRRHEGSKNRSWYTARKEEKLTCTNYHSS